MVEVQMAQGDDVDRPRVEACCLQCWHHGEALVGTHGSGLFVHALADAGLDKQPAGMRLDEQAIEGLKEAMVPVDFVDHQPIPQESRHGTEERACV